MGTIVNGMYLPILGETGGWDDEINDNFRRLGDLPINAKSAGYAALADGLADDTTAIQGAISSGAYGGDDRIQPSTSARGSTTFLSRGVFKITAPLQLRSNQRLVGSGPETVILNTAANTAAIKMGDGVTFNGSRMEVSNLTIDGNAGSFASGGYGIWVKRGFRSIIDRVWVWGTKDTGIYVDGSSYFYIKNGYVQQCAGRGIHLQNDTAPDHVTATWVKDMTVRENYKSGVYMDYCVACFVVDNTIESNGQTTPEALGDSPSQSAVRSMNLYMRGVTYSFVDRNYFEQAGTGTSDTQIGLTSSYKNKIMRNHLDNYVGMYIWSDSATSGTAPVWNTIRDNDFPGSSNPNFVMAKAAASTRANDNWIEDNTELNWAEDGSVYSGNAVTAQASADGKTQAVVEATVPTSYTPDGGVTTGAGGITSGRRKGRIYKLTLTGNATINAPTNFDPGEALTFILVQDGTGGRSVSWNGAFKPSWSDTGNTASKRSAVRFVHDGTNWSQIGAQSPYA